MHRQLLVGLVLLFATCCAGCSSPSEIDSNRVGFGLSSACSRLGGHPVQIVSPGSLTLLEGEVLSRLEISLDPGGSSSPVAYLGPLNEKGPGTVVTPGTIIGASTIEDLNLIAAEGLSLEGPGEWSIVLVDDDPTESSVLATEVRALVDGVILVNSRDSFRWDIRAECG